MRSDIDIAQAAPMRRIIALARERYGIPDDCLSPYGHYKAKLSLSYAASLRDRPDGKLILVTALSPTPAGEGKTTATIPRASALDPLINIDNRFVSRQGVHLCAPAPLARHADDQSL